MQASTNTTRSTTSRLLAEGVIHVDRHVNDFTGRRRRSSCLLIDVHLACGARLCVDNDEHSGWSGVEQAPARCILSPPLPNVSATTVRAIARQSLSTEPPKFCQLVSASQLLYITVIGRAHGFIIQTDSVCRSLEILGNNFKGKKVKERKSADAINHVAKSYSSK